MKFKTLVLAGAMVAGSVYADDAAKPTTPPAALPAADADVKAQIAKLITQLGDDDPQLRQEATDMLRKLGKTAAPALTEARKNPDLEVSSRAEALLRKIDEDSKPKSPAVDEGGFVDGINIAPGRVGIIRGGAGGKFQIQVRAMNGGVGQAIAISRTETNGVKDVSVDENGKKIKIHESAADGITLSIIEKDKDGKEETKDYKAKDAETLRKENPEAGKLYDRFMGQGAGNVNFQIQGINNVNGINGGGGFIVGGNANAADARRMNADLQKMNEAMRQQMAEQRALVDQIQNGGAGADPAVLREAMQRMADLQRQMAEERMKALNGNRAGAVAGEIQMREAMKQAEAARREAEEARKKALEDVERLKKELEAEKTK